MYGDTFELFDWSQNLHDIIEIKDRIELEREMLWTWLELKHFLEAFQLTRFLIVFYYVYFLLIYNGAACLRKEGEVAVSVFLQAYPGFKDVHP